MIHAEWIAIEETNLKTQKMPGIRSDPSRESPGTAIRANFYPPMRKQAPQRDARQTTRSRASSADDAVGAADAVAGADLTPSALRKRQRASKFAMASVALDGRAQIVAATRQLCQTRGDARADATTGHVEHDLRLTPQSTKAAGAMMTSMTLRSTTSRTKCCKAAICRMTTIRLIKVCRLAIAIFPRGTRPSA